MSKVEINNEIVLMRQCVRKAKVSVVQRMIKESKLLRKRHGDEKQKEKFQRKAEKLIKEIMELKKIKDDEISKFGLENERSLKEILQDPKSSARVSAVAKVAFHKTMIARISKFREKFPNFKDHLPTGSRKKKQKQNQKKKPQQETKTKVPGVEESSEPGQLLRVKSPKLEVETDRKEKENGWEVSSVEPEKPQLLKPVSKEAIVRKFTEIAENSDSKDRDSPPKVKSPVKPPKVESPEKPPKVKSLEKPSKVKSPEKPPKVTKQVDPFFMTEDGTSEYLSIVPETEAGNEEEREEGEERWKNRSSWNFQRNDRSKMRERDFRREDKSQYNRESSRNMSWKDKNGMRRKEERVNEKRGSSFQDRVNPGRRIEPSQKRTSDVSNENLHPSWQAKKKQQEILKQGFQGKKIVFDD